VENIVMTEEKKDEINLNKTVRVDSKSIKDVRESLQPTMVKT
jgi:hypothetical protein